MGDFFKLGGVSKSTTPTKTTPTKNTPTKGRAVLAPSIF